ncbi:MAG: isoleucine--tRNA ligase [Firmicutes bacterium]|nr:isoleucine--tRNA ligase [Bacillota bacterium]
MKKFANLSNKSVYETEKEIKEKWLKENILQKSIDNRHDCENFVFYDGPAFANGFPGLHHMMAKNLKDTFCKYKTMQGYKVLRKIGWDTHGLPIENKVEKSLSLNSKKEIEEYGIAKFNDKCRESVRENEDAFVNLTQVMGQFIDTDNPYITFKNEYIETEWWILKKYFESNLFYEGNRVTPYCPRCGTGLASHEVAQGYEDLTSQTVIVPMKKKDEDVYFLVWTTTPWTLISNVGLCVNADLTYVLVESNNIKYILAEALVEKVFEEEVKVLEKYKGKDLEYMEYEQLIPEFKFEKKAFFVCCDDYVTMDSGTGIVHIAPAFGEDDARVGEKYELPVVNPVGKDGCYTDGLWKGLLVFDADLEIIKYLKENNKLFKKQKIVHSYPHCWRCHSPLLYYTLPSYYIAVSKYQDKIIEANKTVNWYPDYVGEKRFGNWLLNLKDWAISRTRYWGTPIPYWKCETCDHAEMIGSIAELQSRSIEKIDLENLDLHRPFIDEIHFTCPKCQGKMTRIVDVLDCWFDSGSMPFAQYHYPFENKELFESQFPADFISEGIDQTRGWFYTLLVISTFVTGKSPFKNVLVNDLLLDAEGKKMSKSRGNIVEPFTTIEKYGADTVRFYLPYISPVWTPLKFDINGLKEVHSKFFNPLKNTYNFFALYANTDNIDLNECFVKIEDREEIDKWLISKYNRLLKYVTESFEEYDLNKVVKALTTFVSDDLSNWYIRRNRNRFWDSKLNISKKSVYITTYEVLVGLTKMIAPIVPYLSEEMYTKLTDEYSVHLADFPKYDESLINDALEHKMDLVRTLISVGRNIREENKIRVRQPLPKILLDSKNEIIIGDLTNLIKEELNVKEVIFIKDASNYLNYTIKPNFKEVGKILGSNMKEFQSKLEVLNNKMINKLINNETIEMKLNDEVFEINKNMIEVKISAKDGFNVGMENNEFVILNTTLNQDLINEGIAREFVSKVQNLRKEKDLDVSDRIIINYNADEEIINALNEYQEYIKNETLALNLIIDKNINNIIDFNEKQINIEIKKSVK